jgi:NRAMP (natural resistance-associated macrophage protein)-like metal ion transporter
VLQGRATEINSRLRRLRAPVKRLRPRLLRLRRRGFWAYLAMMGPGFITASAGNDAGGIATYAKAGAVYGDKLLWAMVVTAVSLVVVQEMCARMGAVTGKGLSDLIREEFGIGWAALAMICLFIANGAITASEFVGIKAATLVLQGQQQGGPSALLPIVVVIITAVGLWWLVTRSARGPVERVLLAMTLVFLAYIPAALTAVRDWGGLLRHIVTPTLGDAHSPGMVAFLIALVGTTISPYMQFYVQSSVVEKGVTIRDYRYTRVEVIVGSLFAILIAMFIIIATSATLYGHGDFSNPKDAGVFAVALRGVLGSWAELLFALGLFGASLLAAAVLPLSTAFAICEVFGFESGVDKSFGEAPIFNGLFTGLIAAGALVALVLPSDVLVNVLVGTQAINGVILTVVLLFILRLVNKRQLMGAYTNGPIFNAVAFASAGVLIVLTALLMLGVLFSVGPAAG